MITVKTNVGAWARKSLEAIERVQDKNYVLAGVALTMAAKQRERIFEKGKNSDGGKIGRYSDSYLKERLREGFTPSRKVILKRTGQMEGDYKPIATARGYGIGFDNAANAEKARHNEDRYGAIFRLTKQERNQSKRLIQKRISDILNGRDS